LYPLHILLFTIPGVPSVYYGSEWGILGKKGPGDEPLRPALQPDAAAKRGAHPELRPVIQRLAAVRQRCVALRHGSYQELLIASRQFAFERVSAEQRAIVVVNAAEREVEITVKLSQPSAYSSLRDALDEGRP